MAVSNAASPRSTLAPEVSSTCVCVVPAVVLTCADVDEASVVEAALDPDVAVVAVVAAVVDGARVVIPAFSFLCSTAASLRLCKVAVEISRFTPAFESITPARLTALVRAGLLLFTIFFNCSQTCAGVAEVAMPWSSMWKIMLDAVELNFRPSRRRNVEALLMAKVVFKLLGICSTLFIFTRTVSALETASARRLDMVMMALQVSL
mmetsp:Transcript_35701/g.77135  ORF Transcript_35701/g.77135 Transcript_35701/m.77135 type:complete len:206 (+) Transcript_35701:133-750(+)